MRIIGGSARGRPLKLPKELDVRPTADRVREAMFDVLDHLDLIDGASVVDLFAGSGALGIEAVSRGAETAVFVDSDRAVLLAVQANLDSTKIGELATCRVGSYAPRRSRGVARVASASMSRSWIRHIPMRAGLSCWQ